MTAECKCTGVVTYDDLSGDRRHKDEVTLDGEVVRKGCGLPVRVPNGPSQCVDCEAPIEPAPERVRCVECSAAVLTFVIRSMTENRTQGAA